MPMIGTNLTGCLLSIHRKEVKIEDVALILSSTQYLTRDEMVEDLRRTMRGHAIDSHLGNAELLWNTGRIFQSMAPKTYKRHPLKTWMRSTDVFSYR